MKSNSQPLFVRRGLAAGLTMALVAVSSPRVSVQAAPPAGADAITAAELKTWLSVLASDEFEGRATFTEGLGLAAAYIAGELKAMGVKPGGENGSYFQRVPVRGWKTTSRSTITVTVNGESRTFKDGQGVTFPRNSGGKQTLNSDQIEFVGYGLNIPPLNHDDYAGRDVKGKVAIFIGARGPKGAESREYRRLLGGRSRYGLDVRNTVATIGPSFGGFGPPAGAPAPAVSPTPAPAPAPAGPGGGFGQQALPTPDFTAVTRLDQPMAPAVTAQDAFFEFLFSGSDIKYAQLKAKAEAQEPLPAFSLKGVSISFNVDADYQVVRTRFTRNVIGIVEGADAKLKDSFVAYGAHYDHVGYAEGELVDAPVTEQNPSGKRRLGAVGQVTPSAIEDRIWNGADDDGSGTVVLLSLAKAFATAPKPKRSQMFVFHAGEESGLLGSRYYADYPLVPVEKLVAVLNMDMVGRNNDDRATEENTVYLVGSDRISTELHNISEDANAAQKPPLKLDYAMNDTSDLEQVYYRSDHYSYAAKGVPVIFYTTGLHGDYHRQTDSLDKIRFEKMARIGRLVYETGRRVSNLDHAPARDNKGPRAGKTITGKIAER